MNSPIQFRQATPNELNRILEIIRQAQAQMAALGSNQWQNGYPALPDITRDIARGWGYVLCRDHRVIAYAAVVFDGERAYDALEGNWLTAATDYVVVHRLAVADEAKREGIATHFMREIEQLACQRGISSFRIDTNFDNGYMLALLHTLGFGYCGKVHYASGERLAFEKELKMEDKN